MPHPGLLHPEPLPLRQATADPYLHRRHCVWVNTVWAQPLWGLQVLVWTRYVWALQVSLLSAILPLLLSCWGYSFALGHGVSYFGGMQHSPIDGCSAGSCNFGVLAGEDEHTSFYSAMSLESSSLQLEKACMQQWTPSTAKLSSYSFKSLSQIFLFLSIFLQSQRELFTGY